MPTTCYIECPYLTRTSLCKVTTWQGKLLIKNPKNSAKNYSIISILSSPPHRTWGNMATPKIPSERREVSRQILLHHERMKQKAGGIISSTSLAGENSPIPALQSSCYHRELRSNQDPTEATPDNRTDGQRPGDKIRYPRGDWTGQTI